MEWCNRFVSSGWGYTLSVSVVFSWRVGCGVSRDLARPPKLKSASDAPNAGPCGVPWLFWLASY